MDATLTAQYYTGNTVADLVDFDFSNWTGATLTVKQSERAANAIVEFDTLDGSIVLSSGGTFQLVKTAAELATIQAGSFRYSMYLRNDTYTHRAFLSGAFYVETQII